MYITEESVNTIAIHVMMFLWCRKPGVQAESSSEDELDKEERERQADLKERDEFAKRLKEKDKDKTRNMADKVSKSKVGIWLMVINAMFNPFSAQVYCFKSKAKVKHVTQPTKTPVPKLQDETSDSVSCEFSVSDGRKKDIVENFGSSPSPWPTEFVQKEKFVMYDACWILLLSFVCSF